MIAAETYLQLMSDPAHWLMELTVEVTTGILLYPLGRRFVKRWVKRHDRHAHNLPATREPLYHADECQGEIGWFVYMRGQTQPCSELYDSLSGAQEVADRWNKRGSRWG